ncbi:MAG: hypothetical protein PHI35_08020 [Victivallaceae bacterium]|nr:hypothetical protein [Victivallaceae bacterium]
MIIEDQENKKLETDMLLNGIDIPLELLDRNGCFISANKAFLELLQIPCIQKGKQCHKFNWVST